MNMQNGNNGRVNGAKQDFDFIWFSRLLNRPVCIGNIRNRLGKLTDLVFRLSEPHPTAVGIYLEHGWGKPTEFIPWEQVVSIDDDAIFVKPPENRSSYPPFTDQSGWILVDQHLMGRTVLDTDGRRVEVVNDVHLLHSKGRMIIVHVDVSFNGFLRKWGMGNIKWIKDRLISWRYVQPLSVEDAVTTDAVSLSVKKGEAMDLPGEDLADVLEVLSGKEQEALFSALDSEKAAETLAHAEPRAKRQIIASLRKERAYTILSELSVPQLADLFSVLPHVERENLMGLLPEKQAVKIERILSEREVTADELISQEFVTLPKEMTVGEALRRIKGLGPQFKAISYIYIVTEEKTLMGVIDLRELVLTEDDTLLEEIMVTSVVEAEEKDTREDLVELFLRYHFRMIPVVDAKDKLLGVIYHNDIIAHGLTGRARI